MNRRIAVVTGSRADYGLLRWVMEGIAAAPDLDLQVVATGMHLSPAFGLTCREIEADGFHLDERVEMLLGSDTHAAIAKSIGIGVIGFADALRRLQPDLLIVLGDRFEIFAAVTSALVACIPVAHLHGGETTEGAFDDAFRHAITKMSHLHFVAHDTFRARVLQLGEPPDRVFTVGAVGLDGIDKLPLLDRAALETALDFRLGAHNLLVTYHSVTLEPGAAAGQTAELLAALDMLPDPDTGLLFTMPNADPEGRGIRDLIEAYVRDRPRARAYTSLGQLRYLSCLRHVDGVVGNSSSGLIEAPSFRTGTINIGDRQRGRPRAASVIDCAPDRAAIASALQRLFSSEFQRTLPGVRNPYGDGGASERVVNIVRTHPLGQLLKKPFHDLPQARPPGTHD